MNQFTDYVYATPDGLSLYCRDYPGPDSGAPVVLCLHGLTRNSRDFQYLAPALAPHFRVLVPEQRGRGRSDYATDSSSYALMQYVEDVRGLLQSLAVEAISVVGTSMGGLMTFALNALYPGLIRAAVINDIGPEIAPAGLERIKSLVGVAGPFADWEEATAYLAKTSSEIFPRWTRAEWSDFARQCYIERENQVVIDYDPKIAEGLAGEASGAEAEVLWSLFSALATVPTLLIRGELTDLLSEETVQRMASAHADFSVLNVPDVGHAPMLNEAGVTEAIAQFLLTRTA